MEPMIKNPPKMMTMGMVKSEEWMRKVAMSSPVTPQPIPKRRAPMHLFLLEKSFRPVVVMGCIS